jgi:hypothetical protein
MGVSIKVGGAYVPHQFSLKQGGVYVAGAAAFKSAGAYVDAGGGTPVSNNVDLFVIVGQSNALGIGTAAESPSAPHGFWINGSNAPVPLVDPLGNVNTGSSWPAFSNEWRTITGRRSAYVYAAAVGSSLVAAGTGWNPTGNLRAQAVTAANQAIGVLTGNPTYPLGNVYLVWLQGEQEAQTINGTTITGATYEAALEDLATYFKAQIPTMQTMGVIHISGPAGSTGAGATQQTATHLGYQEIRAAQTRAIADHADLSSAYDGSYHFVGRGLSKDGTHYSQTGYNLNGKMAARGVHGSLGSLPAVVSPFISSASYPRASYGFDGSRTVSHTTPAGTNFLIVALAHGWPNSALQAAPTVTFGGVSMRRAVFTGNVSLSAPNGTAYASIFYIDDTMYGAPLAGVTANIVATTGNNQRNICFAAINARDVVLGDTESGAFPAAATPGTPDVSAPLTTFSASTLVVAVAAGTNNAGAAALTATMSGVTEIMDAGFTNGTEASGMCVGYAENTSRVIGGTVSATFSANVTHRALAVAAFRPKYTGEYP